MSGRVDRLSAALDQGRADAASIEGEMARVVARVLRAATRYAADRLARYATPIALVAVGNTDPHADPTTWALPDADEVLPADYVREQLDKGLARFRTPLVKSVMQPPLEAFGLHFDERNPLVVGVLGQLGQRITHVSEAVRRDTMASLEASHADGESIPDAAARLVADLGSPEVSQARGELIARTEFLGAANASSLAAAMLTTNGGDQGERKFWIATGDDRTRDSHLQAADDYSEDHAIALQDAFAVGDDQLRYPGDPDGSPAEVINCRCTLGYTDQGQAADAAAEAAAGPVAGSDEFAGPDAAQAGAGFDQAVLRDVVLQHPSGDYGKGVVLSYAERGPGFLWKRWAGKDDLGSVSLHGLYRSELSSELESEVKRARAAIEAIPKGVAKLAVNKPKLAQYVADLDAHEAALKAEIARVNDWVFRDALNEVTTGLVPLSDRVTLRADTATDTYGDPLSARRQAELTETFSHALDAIDSVLYLPKGPNVEVGAYFPYQHAPGTVDQLGTAWGRYASFTNGIEMNVDTPLLQMPGTLAHEVGHYVDKRLWGNALGSAGFATEHPELLPTQALRDRMLDVLQAMKDSNAQVRMTEQFENKKALGLNTDWHTYALDVVEVWARAFDQWVGMRAPGQMGEDWRRSNRAYQGSAGSYAQWTEEDFAPIAKAMDALFEEAGWLVK